MQYNNATNQIIFRHLEYIFYYKRCVDYETLGKSFFLFVCKEVGSLIPYTHSIYFGVKWEGLGFVWVDFLLLLISSSYN